ncbi:MAG: DUF1611 domain-containing protein [Pseudomonadota bacterium]
MLTAPYILFLGDVVEPGFAKTAYGLLQWRREACQSQITLPGCQVDLGLRTILPEQAAQHGATLILGVAGRGGKIPTAWLPALIAVAKQGVDIASGGHTRLRSFPELIEAAQSGGARLLDLRDPPATLPIATGIKRTGKRLLTVGTDCAVGKKYSALALAQEMTDRGMNTTFRATGQTGIMIAGSGIPIDAVVSDFTAGAAETLSPSAAADHWDVIEGQGSLFHPSYAGVCLGLLHGSQPDAFVLCHDAGRAQMLGLSGFPVPDVRVAIDANLSMARLTNPRVQCIGVSANTSAMSNPEARAALDGLARRTGLPCTDPLRYGVSALVDAVEAL